MITDFWNSLNARSRGGLIAGAVLIVAATAGLAAWLLRTDYQVLFADLNPQDAAAMTAELERMKEPYRIAADGNTILVDAATVHTTRMKLMGKDIPLHGAAGFELFNNADFGMTEFAQKINYQRALQGEITRTILSLSQVRDARVHLALPEEGLFKRATSKAKAAITLSLKPGMALQAEQITGIQRLVAAAVPGITMHDVTIVDQQGVALTRPVVAEGEQDIGSARLDLKRDTERMLARKAMEVLESAFGPGQAVATVDVTLNMDQVRVTTEEVLGARGGQGVSGVIVRERENARDAGPPLSPQGEATRAANSQREVEYQVGRRTEQVASQPGAIKHLQVVALVRQPLSDEQIERMRQLVGAAVGTSGERADTVVVQSMHAFESLATAQGGAAAPASAAASAPALAVAPAAHPPAARTTAPSTAALPPLDALASSPQAVVIALACMLIAALCGLAVWLRVRSSATRASPTARTLSSAERAAVLQQMHHWLDTGARQ
ncbi:flagellar basal-body MS-ring/collar protein FliF [Caenimonas koreensis]|uniref:flagellar basal-body MS-ring/collar protein FliF n=1 Tax=Caenimonas koreensis TaxID=367474 RepID=UPI002B268327|nr:flagellar basal-body MS-ring/collar protein FliF [Caenimonas koreensis]